MEKSNQQRGSLQIVINAIIFLIKHLIVINLKMKQTKILIVVAVVTMLFLQACNGNKSLDAKVSKDVQSNVSSEIIGNVCTITFPQFKVEETFVSDTIVHWKIVDEEGATTESDEVISYKKLNDNLFFISWIEKTGLTVSQVLDVEKAKVTAFISNKDEKSARGKRSSMFLEGSLDIKNKIQTIK